MFLETLILATIIIFFLKNKDTKNLLYFKFNNLYLVIIGIIILILINIFSSFYVKNISEFIINKYFLFHIISLVLISIGLISNYKNIGFLIVGFGIFLNTIPIMFNKKMPVNLDALLKTNNNKIIKIITENQSLSHGVFDKPKFYFLSDIIPLIKPWGNSVVISFGDILICIGLIISLIYIVKSGSE